MASDPDAPRLVLSESKNLSIQYRYVLENVLNGKLSEETKKHLGIALAKFD
jgi:hypothetical protein